MYIPSSSCGDPEPAERHPEQPGEPDVAVGHPAAGRRTTAAKNTAKVADPADRRRCASAGQSAVSSRGQHGQHPDHDVRRRDQPGRQVAGAPVHDREGDAHRHEVEQEQQRRVPADPGAEQAAGHRARPGRPSSAARAARRRRRRAPWARRPAGRSPPRSAAGSSRGLATGSGVGLRQPRDQLRARTRRTRRPHGAGGQRGVEEPGHTGATLVAGPGPSWRVPRGRWTTSPGASASAAAPAARIASSGARERRSSARPGAPPGAPAGRGRRPGPVRRRAVAAASGVGQGS